MINKILKGLGWEIFILLFSLFMFFDGYWRIKFALMTIKISDYYVYSYGNKGILYCILGLIALFTFFGIKLLKNKK